MKLTVSSLVFTWLVMTMTMNLSGSSSSTSAAIRLTQQNYERLTNGKAVFIKFYAPWCGHCQELAPHWEQMANNWAEATTKQAADTDDDNTPLIAEVDCTQEEKWCIELGITGFPTLLYGDPSHGGVFLKEYDGDKDGSGLFQFVQDTVSQPFCSPGNIGNGQTDNACSEQERLQIEEYWNLPLPELQDRLQVRQDKIETRHKLFDEEFQTMQTKYNSALQEKELAVLKANQRLQLLLEVQKSRATN